MNTSALHLLRRNERKFPHGKPHLAPQFRKDFGPVATDKSSSSLQNKEHFA